MPSEVNLEQARFNMVEQQIRPWEVLNQQVLELIENTPRHEFVPTEYCNLAYADTCIPLGHGQVMMPPNVEARMLQALDPRPTDIALEIGTGSGYVTALLAKACKHVDSIEIIPELSEVARARLEAHGITNVTLEVGDASAGLDTLMRYDIIAITASVPMLQENYQYSLNIGGRLFVITGESPSMEAVLITRVGENEWQHESLFETDTPPLINAPEPQRFVF
jgi:protein-L-isoaspartate(D-aspartate) O-methyltransferase